VDVETVILERESTLPRVSLSMDNEMVKSCQTFKGWSNIADSGQSWSNSQQEA